MSCVSAIGEQPTEPVLRKRDRHGGPRHGDVRAPKAHLGLLPAPPVIVRIAGLPASVMEPFSSEICLSQFAARQQLRDALRQARSRMVEILYQAVPLSPPPLRRFLLAIKRQCFNDRSIRDYRDAAEWTDLQRVSGHLVDRIADLETQLSENDRQFKETYLREQSRERHHLLAQLETSNVARGVALASPDLIARARRLRGKPFASFGRKDKKVERSLLRFVSRSAVKLSPYSTLTPVGLGLVHSHSDVRLRLLDGSIEEHSLFRVNRTILEQCCGMLLSYPVVRAHCRVALNDTLEEIEPGRYRFLQPSHWHFDRPTGNLCFVSASQVKATLGGPLITSLKSLLNERTLPYGRLVAELEKVHSPDGESDTELSREICATLDKLESLGFLKLLLPWPTCEPHLEHRLLSYLETFSGHHELRPLVDILKRLIALEEGYSLEPKPETSVKRIRAALGALLRAVQDLIGRRPEQHQIGSTDLRSLYEDVFLVSNGETNSMDREILQVSSKDVDEVMTHAEALSRFCCLYSHRHDILHTLAALWCDRWPLREEIGFLELFHEVQDMWKGYLKFDFDQRNSLFSSFNPLNLRTIDLLNHMRADIFEKTQQAMEQNSEGRQLPLSTFCSILDDIPDRYAPLVGACVFVQPVDYGQNVWVLNRLFEGTGRYGSRYSVVMDESMRSRFITHLLSRSAVEIDDEKTELLDLMFTNGNTSNLRIPQTSRVLEIPGEHIGLSPERRVLLRDLKIRINRARRTFRLVDSAGQRYLPVHLSSVSNLYMPVILRFLTVFGPYEVRQVFPRPQPRVAGEDKYFDRVTCGKLVIRRKRWELGSHTLRNSTSKSTSDVGCFESVQRWRLERGLPPQVFLYEQILQAADGGEVYKPQYLDFTSPSFMSLFMSILRSEAGGGRLIFEEALPNLASFLPGRDRDRWGVELQIDSIALGEGI